MYDSLGFLRQIAYFSVWNSLTDLPPKIIEEMEEIMNFCLFEESGKAFYHKTDMNEFNKLSLDEKSRMKDTVSKCLLSLRECYFVRQRRR